MSFALNIIAKSTVILVTAAVLCLLLRRASAASRHAVWVLAVMSALLLPIATAILPQLQLLVLQVHTSVWLILMTFQVAITTTGQGAKPIFLYSVWELLVFVWGAGLALLL